MKFAISLFGHHPLDKPSPENFQEVVALARQARAAGFDMVHAGQHYMVHNFCKFQPIPALARISAETGDMLVNILELLPLNHPVRVAETLSTIDAMTNGHVVFTGALGYSEQEFENFGVPKKYRLGRFLEAIEIIKRLWTEDHVSFEGKHFRLDNVTINPKPVQKPRPPIWMTADAVEGILRTAEKGDAWLISNHGRVEEVKGQLAIYRERRQGRVPQCCDNGIHQPMMRILYVAETRAEALQMARPHIEATWKEYYGSLGQAKEMDNPDDFTQEFENLWKDRFVFDTPEGCIRQIERFQQELGVDCLMISIPGSLDQKLRCLERMGRQVIPYFK